MGSKKKDPAVNYMARWMERMNIGADESDEESTASSSPPSCQPISMESPSPSPQQSSSSSPNALQQTPSPPSITPAAAPQPNLPSLGQVQNSFSAAPPAPASVPLAISAPPSVSLAIPAPAALPNQPPTPSPPHGESSKRGRGGYFGSSPANSGHNPRVSPSQSPSRDLEMRDQRERSPPRGRMRERHRSTLRKIVDDYHKMESPSRRGIQTSMQGVGGQAMAKGVSRAQNLNRNNTAASTGGRGFLSAARARPIEEGPNRSNTAASDGGIGSLGAVTVRPAVERTEAQVDTDSEWSVVDEDKDEMDRMDEGDDF